MSDRNYLLAEARPATTPATSAGGTGTAQTVWSRCALRGRVRTGAPAGDAPFSPELRSALAAVDAALLGSDSGSLSAPSAGALYPYETVVVCNEGGSEPDTRAYLLRTTDRTVRAIEADSRLHLLVLAARRAGLAECRAVLLTVARPWLSMRKYGDRGWMYTQLDAAHASCHVLVSATHTHRRALLLDATQLRVAAAALGLTARCRTLHSAVALGAPVPHATTDGWTLLAPNSAASPFPVVEAAERLVWQDLGLPAAEAVETDRTTPPLPSDLVATLAMATSLRQSAKDFRPASLPVERVADLLRTVSAPVGTVRTTLVAGRIAGLAAGAYELVDDELRPRLHGGLPDADIVVDMCMGQTHLGDSCAAVVVHAPRGEVLGHGRGGLELALADAGTAGHLLYLAAVGQGVGITAIGGFDAVRWHGCADLPEDQEVLYVLMLGASGAATVKADRLPQCRAHGER